jgi:3-oxoacyl-[acyl-carrier-protein] synthase-1
MLEVPVALLSTGLVTSVGLSAPASCAAIRAKLTQPSETRFSDSAGNWIMCHAVPLEQSWRGLKRLAAMAALSIDECLAGTAREEWSGIPLLLCVAELDRPGRLAGLDDQLFTAVQDELGVRFAANSSIVAHGRASAAVAMAAASRLLAQGSCSRVLIAATDSLLLGPTLTTYEQADRLLTDSNSNGFMPGEGAGAVLVGRADGAPGLRCIGIGFGIEQAHIHSGEPLRADGLSTAIRNALSNAERDMYDMDWRMTDLSGEQYYFKEAALALSRVLRRRKETFDIWHPAESTGETGAVAGLAMLAVADAACRKGYSPGHHIVAHMAADGGQRAAAIFHYVGSP